MINFALHPNMLLLFRHWLFWMGPVAIGLTVLYLMTCLAARRCGLAIPRLRPLRILGALALVGGSGICGQWVFEFCNDGLHFSTLISRLSGFVVAGGLSGLAASATPYLALRRGVLYGALASGPMLLCYHITHGSSLGRIAVSIALAACIAMAVRFPPEADPALEIECLPLKAEEIIGDAYHEKPIPEHINVDPAPPSRIGLPVLRPPGYLAPLSSIQRTPAMHITVENVHGLKSGADWRET